MNQDQRQTPLPDLNSRVWQSDLHASPTMGDLPVRVEERRTMAADDLTPPLFSSSPTASATE